MTNNTGNVGNLFGLGGSGSFKKRRKSTKGYYRVAFVESYTDITENDLAIKDKYLIDAISRHLGVPKEMITLRKKTTNQTLASLDEVYYVKVGVDTLGKVSMRTQRMFTKINMEIIYQERNLTDNTNQKRGMRVYDKKRKSSTLEQRRRNKGKGSEGKFTR